jgi:hypothetical protein
MKTKTKYTPATGKLIARKLKLIEAFALAGWSSQEAGDQDLTLRFIDAVSEITLEIDTLLMGEIHAEAQAAASKGHQGVGEGDAGIEDECWACGAVSNDPSPALAACGLCGCKIVRQGSCS